MQLLASVVDRVTAATLGHLKERLSNWAGEHTGCSTKDGDGGDDELGKEHVETKEY